MPPSSRITTETDWGALNFISNNGNVNSNNFWTRGTGFLYSASGLYPANGPTRTVVDGDTYGGEWIQIQMPLAVRISQVYMGTRVNDTLFLRAPRQFIIAGSNNGFTWSSVFIENNRPTWGANVPYVMSLPGTTAYSYYRINVLATCGAVLTNIGEIALYASDI